VSDLLDCKKADVYFLIQQGELETIRIGPRALRVSQDSLKKFLKKAQERAKDEPD